MENTSGFDLDSEVMYSCSMWHSAHVALGMGCICFTVGMGSGFTVDLSGLNLGSGGIKIFDIT